jgi:hypothetical protein
MWCVWLGDTERQMWNCELEMCRSGGGEVIIWYGRCGVCGQGILRDKCGIVNCKYVTVEFRMLYFDMADVVCVVRG